MWRCTLTQTRKIGHQGTWKARIVPALLAVCHDNHHPKRTAPPRHWVSAPIPHSSINHSQLRSVISQFPSVVPHLPECKIHPGPCQDGKALPPVRPRNRSSEHGSRYVPYTRTLHFLHQVPSRLLFLAFGSRRSSLAMAFRGKIYRVLSTLWLLSSVSRVTRREYLSLLCRNDYSSPQKATDKGAGIPSCLYSSNPHLFQTLSPHKSPLITAGKTGYYWG